MGYWVKPPVVVPLAATGAKLLRVPPVTSMSDRAKVVLASDRVKVMVSVLVLPLSAPVPLRATTMVGGVVSEWVSRMTLKGALSGPTLPAASVAVAL